MSCSGIIGIIGAVNYISWAVYTNYFVYCVTIGGNIGSLIVTSYKGFDQRNKNYEAALGIFISSCLVSRHYI